MSRPNFFELLTSLSFDPPSKGPTIKTEIDNAIMSWQNQLACTTESAKRAELQGLLQLENEMRGVLLNPVKLKMEADAMRQKQLQLLNEELDFIISMGLEKTFTPFRIRETVMRLRLSIITVKRAFEEKGFSPENMIGTKVNDILPASFEMYRIETLIKALKTTENPSFPDHSKVETVYDAISLLDRIEFSRWQDTKHWNVTQLQNRCHAVSARYSVRNDVFSRVCKEIASFGTIIFKDEVSRVKYDNAIQFNELRTDARFAILQRMDSTIKKDSRVAEQMIAIIQQFFPSRDDALTIYNYLVSREDPYQGLAVMTDYPKIKCPRCGTILKITVAE